MRIVTKVGFIINDDARVLERMTTDPDEIEASLDASRRPLRRDRIDIVLLHLNSLPKGEANANFDRLKALRARGWVGHFGWSTDFPDRVAGMAGRPGFAAVEHATNLFFAADQIGAETARHGLLPLIRSPLAMGLHGGRYKAGHRFGPDDVRSRTVDWMDYFKDRVVTDDHAEVFDRLRDLLTSDGAARRRGALAWLMARNPRVAPLPGFRVVEQVQDLVGVLSAPPVEASAMAAIEVMIARGPEGLPRERLGSIPSGRTGQFGALLAERRQRNAECAACRQN